MNHVAYIRMRGQPELRDRAEHCGGIFRFEFNSLRTRAAGNFNLGKFRDTLLELEFAADFGYLDGGQIMMRSYQVANEFAVSVRGPLDMQRRDPKVREHLLHYRSRVKPELSLQR